MNETEYQRKLEEIFVRFPSVQNTGFGEAYKPGLAHMEDFDALLGRPSRSFSSLHVAGTNGKGSVANMLASALAATGRKVGLYTSPHILDFRERMRVIDGGSDGPARMIGKDDVWDFIQAQEETFKRLNLSFFEITTGMAFWWFAKEKVDLAVIEVGLGGRLDSTNIITPLVSIVTSIGLDHCAQLGDTRAAIAGEKAGIFKPGVPAVVGSRDDETAPVFEARAAAVSCPLVFADDTSSPEITTHFLDRILAEMDLQGEYQRENLRTVMVTLDILGVEVSETVLQAIRDTAKRMDFHGRWEMLHRDPDILCDIGHNPPALKKNFAQLREYLSSGRYERLIIVYGVMADKDLDGIMPLMPPEAEYVAVAPDTARALPAGALYERLRAGLPAPVALGGSVASGLAMAIAAVDSGLAVGPSPAICYSAHARHADPFRANAVESPLPNLPDSEKQSINTQTEIRMPIRKGSRTLIYVGGSTFVVSEAIAALSANTADRDPA